MQLKAIVAVCGIGFVHQPGTVFEMDDGPEARRLLALKSAEEVKPANEGTKPADDEFLTDEEETRVRAELMKVKGMTKEQADALIGAEVQSLADLAACKAKQLYKVVGKDCASGFIKQAKALIQ